jgi:hypothetical protein
MNAATEENPFEDPIFYADYHGLPRPAVNATPVTASVTDDAADERETLSDRAAWYDMDR